MPALHQGQPGARHHARGTTSRVVSARSVRGSIALLLLCLHLTGCFHYVPVAQAAPPEGSQVSLGVTDRGRVELTPVFGPGIRRIGGSLLETTDTSYVLLVTQAQYLDTGLPASWDGSRMEIAREFVDDVQERRLSPVRTGIFAGALAVAAVAVSFIAIRGLGIEGGSERPPPGNGDIQ